MELRQLEYLVAVVEEANFTRAASRVDISQSGVSAQIRRLEEELGAPLIDRSGRTATVTPAGAAALGHARAVLSSVAALRRAVDEVASLIRGRLVVGMVNGCRVTPLFEALASFHRSHPGVEIALVEADSDQLIEDVRTGDTDLALVATAGAPPAGLDGFPIVSERLVAGVPDGHLLAGRRRATLAKVCEHPIVCLPVGTGIRAVFDQACGAQGIEPDVTLHASAPETVADLAGRGFGVAVLSESTLTGNGDRLHAVTIGDVDTPAVLALSWSTSATPALHELVRHCRRSFGIEERCRR